MQMNWKKIILVGLAAGIASFIVGSILYMNPVVSDIYSASAASYCAKPMEPFAGWMLLMFAGGLVSAMLLTLLYSYAEKGIAVRPDWKKGLFFGFLFWLVSGLPNAYNTWLLHSYPDAIVLAEAFNGLAGALVAGIAIGVAYGKIK
jgi:hypothetical protein